MTRQHLLSCLAAAEVRLAFTAAANGGHGVRTLRLGETHHCPDEAPDALCADPGDPYTETLLYDVRRRRFLTVAWGDWLEAQEAGR